MVSHLTRAFFITGATPPATIPCHTSSSWYAFLIRLEQHSLTLFLTPSWRRGNQVFQTTDDQTTSFCEQTEGTTEDSECAGVRLAEQYLPIKSRSSSFSCHDTRFASVAVFDAQYTCEKYGLTTLVNSSISSTREKHGLLRSSILLGMVKDILVNCRRHENFLLDPAVLQTMSQAQYGGASPYTSVGKDSAYKRSTVAFLVTGRSRDPKEKIAPRHWKPRDHLS